jgi:outer membrane receptor protein involved in Fe transport
MGRKLYLPLIIVFTAIFSSAIAQTGEIRGRVIEKGGTEGVPFASVAALQGGAQVIAGQTDIDGNYVLKPLSPGKYDVKVTSVGYSPSEKSGVVVSSDVVSYANVDLAKGIELGPVQVTEYVVPLIEKGPSVQHTVTYDEIQAMPTRDINSIASTAAAVGQADQGKDLNIRGSRSDATGYYVDGIKMRGGGSTGLSNRGAEQVTVITGGLPAKYGDATGGVIISSTREPARNFTGGVELSSSKLTDPYNNNTLSFDLSGPIYTTKDKEGKKSGLPLVGFFISGDGSYDGDPSPSASGGYRLKPSLLSDIQTHPLVLDESGVFYHRGIHFTLDSLEKIKARQDMEQKSVTINGKILIHPFKNFDITLGGAYQYTDGREYIRFYDIMNSENNGNLITKNWHSYVKFSQRFAGTAEAEKSASAIKRGFYSIQFDYNQTNDVHQNKSHEDRIWEYGYLGQFTSYQAPLYVNDSNTRTFHLANGDSIVGVYPVLNGYIDTLYTFSPSDLNPNAAAFNNQYYSETTDGPRVPVVALWDNSLVDIPFYQGSSDLVGGLGGWLNGDNRIRPTASVYGLWATPGRIRTQYEKTQTNQFSVKAAGEADIKNHSLSLGIEYEQRSDRDYTVAPNGLWNMARLLGNGNITNLDTNTAYISVNPNAYIQGKESVTDTVVNYNWKYVPNYNADGEQINGFYENLRKRLGVPMNQWVDVDNLKPDFYRNSLDLFTPDQLLIKDPAQFGFNPFMSYYGYDYLGNSITGKPSLKSYFTDKDAGNNYIRQWGAFQPIYVAGYVQDAFRLNDINFNIGVRVDRFDANQPSLVDKYLLYPAHTVGDQDVQNLAVQHNIVIPSNIGKDYVVYVNDYANPSKILGYRHNDDWYDANGNTITDVAHVIAGASNTGSIQPWLLDPSYIPSNPNHQANKVIDLEDHGEGTKTTFKDYEPQTTFMPRVAFSFPISDEANFKAHYDVLTQRPSDNVRFHPQDYLYMSQGTTFGTINNPDLKPQKTVDYEIEFQQRISRSSAFSISAFYKEMRDMIQTVSVRYAYPGDYTSYGNFDFGTSKGLTLSYDLRRTDNIRIDANYTLQFADGTANSDFGTGTNVNTLLSQFGYSNFVEPINLDFDERHHININIDYHYSSGKDYNGPVWFGKQFFANAGALLQLRTFSGRPYTRLVGYTHSTIVGTPNGSRKPWQFRIDAKIDKSFDIKTGTKGSGEKKKPLALSVYASITNLLDTRNVLDVYKITGSAEDDGYLTYPGNQTTINGQLDVQSYRDLYYAYYAFDPDHYSLPRRIRLGVIVSF